jgi:polysaccharide pyruvyl transferase WcaK-like protein
MAPVIAFINPAVSTENVGDLFIVDSLKKILVHDPEHSFDVDPRRPITERDIARMNEADAAVIAGTNLWYRRMPKPGRWMFSLNDLEQIKTPIIPFGVGTTRHSDDDHGFEPETEAQIKYIHQSCTVGSARDWRTAEVLNKAGIDNVAMTGCPTLFRSLEPHWKVNRRAGVKKVVVTVRKGQARNVKSLLKQLQARDLEPVIAAQQDGDNFLAKPMPVLPFLRPAVTTLYRYDIQPYLRLLEESVGAIGWRLHGNMIHLAHGNPAILFSNCSRGESFCQSFGLPRVPCPDHTRLEDGKIAEMIDALLDPGTFTALPGHYAEHRATMARFLDANALPHNLRGAPSTERVGSGAVNTA